MYCQNCGSAINPQTKFCVRCGTNLVPTGEKNLDKAAEKRLNEYLDGVFWVTVFGLGFIVGGTILLKKVGFSDTVQLIYVVLSSTLFLINFGLNLWRAIGLMRSAKEGKLAMQPGHETRELPPATLDPVIMPKGSVTENTTRSFEPVYNKQKTE
jgi:hypothetical protein